MKGYSELQLPSSAEQQILAHPADIIIMTTVAAACETCGWAAAFCSMLAFGTFGVPIKSQAAVKVDIDPLVFQSYKTFMCFATSWLVILAGEEFVFTPWGIVSGMFWVPGGVATIYAVKNAGLAIGIGIGSSFIVLVSFIWGIFIFDEQVHSRVGASLAVFSMMLGLLGMSYFSSPESVSSDHVEDEELFVDALTTHDAEDPSSVPRRRQSGVDYQGLDTNEAEDEDGRAGIIQMESKLKLTERTDESEYSLSDHDASDSASLASLSAALQDPTMEQVLVCGVTLTKRHLGMLAAAFCGIWGGSIMVPMKYAPKDTKGTHYLVSFAIGSSLVTLSLWLFRYLYNAYKCKSMIKAYRNLPSFHFREMWLAGGLSGTLWSIGNFFSLISVFYLGEGVGYPLVQTSILISGLWGIFYFKEVTGTERISKWFLSSLLTIFGILLLSYEHHEK